MKFYIIVFLIMIACSASFAQSTNNKPSGANVRENTRESKWEEIDRGATYGLETSKAKKKKIDRSFSRKFDKKIEEYEKRMELNAKQYAKMAKEMEKPQYSDPSYFGHKKKPKKRPPGKKKFCKECGMYH